jgi:glutathione-regulated potassium-efflux system protein KefB
MFGLGLAQVSLAIALLSLAGVVVFALSPVTEFIAGSGFVLSSTAVIMSTLQERGEIASMRDRNPSRSCCSRIC